MTDFFRLATALALGLLLAACGGGGDSSATPAVTATPADPGATAPIGSFALRSSAFAPGGAYPTAYTCDGAKSTPPLTWTNAPAGTKAFVLLMTTQPDSSSTKWNWVLYNLPASTAGLVINSNGVGTLGAADDGAGTAYAPPCSQGPGAKTYTFTLYALSALPTLSATASANTGAVVTAAISGLIVGSATLSVTATRAADTTGSTPAAVHCALIQASVANYAAAGVSVDCSASDYGRLASMGLPAHAMMNGITASNLQVPLATHFTGDNAWKIPLTPALAAVSTAVTDGPIGVAVNGVPIFNPCKQGGCSAGNGGGDTKVLGELDVCNGHAGRADDYHYHAAPVCLMADQAASYWDTHPIGWALDGFAIFGYNNADGTVATRDAVCGGNTLAVPNAPAGYSYHLTDTSPYVMSCLRGTPSPDLAGQGAKYLPLRKPPVTPFAVTGMALTTAASDGYQVLQFAAASPFTSTATGTDSYVNAPGAYRIRYKPVTGADLAALSGLAANSGKTACWNFQFTNAAGTATQPTVNYCR